MATETVSVRATAEPPRPYSPSWANVITAWFERLPGPTWLAYLCAIGIGVLFSTAFQGGVGDTASTVYYGALPFAILGLIHLLDRTAGRAIDSIRPLLEMGDAEVAGIHHELTVVPARPAAVLAFVAIALTPLGYVLDPVGSAIVGLSPGEFAARGAWESLVASLFLVLVYHTIRQSRLIGRLHERLGTIDVFDQGALYALSGITSRTAGGLVLLFAPSLFLIPTGADISYIVISAVWYALAFITAAAAFFLPLRGVHDLLLVEKRRLQGEVGRRLTATLAGIHAAVDVGDGQAIEARNRALATLIAERDLVNRIPTWPWSTGALTRFVSAVLLPIALWVATRLLERFV